jgi:hypothetical protein
MRLISWTELTFDFSMKPERSREVVSGWAATPWPAD